jgi:hypothetical protein
MRRAGVRTTVVLCECGEGRGDLVLFLFLSTLRGKLHSQHSECCLISSCYSRSPLGYDYAGSVGLAWFCWESQTTQSSR